MHSSQPPKKLTTLQANASPSAAQAFVIPTATTPKAREVKVTTDNKQNSKPKSPETKQIVTTAGQHTIRLRETLLAPYKKPDTAPAQKQYVQGLDLWIAGEWKQAITCYQRAIELSSPVNLEYLLKLAEAYYKNGQVHEALDTAKKVLIHYQKADIIIKSSFYSTEYPRFKIDKMALQDKEALFFTHLFLGKYYSSMGEPALSLDYYEKALPHTGMQVLKWEEIIIQLRLQFIGYAVDYLNANDPDQALRCYKLIIAIYEGILESFERHLTTEKVALPEAKQSLLSSPQHYLELFGVYFNLLENFKELAIDIKKYKQQAKNLIKRIKDKQKFLQPIDESFFAFAHTVLTADNFSYPITRLDYAKEITHLTKWENTYKVNLEQIKTNPYTEADQVAVILLSKGFISEFIDLPLLQKAQEDSLLVVHQAYFNCFWIQIENIRLYYGLAKAKQLELKLLEATQACNLAIAQYLRLRKEIDAYEKSIRDAKDTQDVKSYKESSLKPVKCLVYQVVVNIYLLLSEVERSQKNNAAALQACVEGQNIITLIDKLKIGRNIKSSEEKIFEVASSRLEPTPLTMMLKLAEQKEKITNQQTIEARFLSLKRKLEEDVDPLTVYYGKPAKEVAIKFPYSMLSQTIKAPRDTGTLRDSVNLSTHAITLVYSNSVYEQTPSLEVLKHSTNMLSREVFLIIISYLANKSKLVGSLPISISNQPDIVAAHTATKVAHKGNWQANTDSISRRVQNGRTLIQMALKDPLTPKLKFFNDVKPDEKFSPENYLHSEQAFFEVINAKPPEQFIEEFKRSHPNFKKGCKVYVVAFDLATDRTSCSRCKTAAISMQSSRRAEAFLYKLQDYLLKNGYVIAGNTKNHPALKAVTRILANQPYTNNHENPENRNVKNLKNMGIFEVVAPAIFASGTEARVKKII